MNLSFTNFFRTHTLDNGETISWKHIHLRLTGLGLGMILVAIASWILALNYSINIAYVLSFWIFSFAIWAMLQAILQLYGCTPILLNTEECFANEQARLTISLQGKNMRHRRVYLRFLDDNNEEEQPAMQFLNTANEELKSVELSFPVFRRGITNAPVLQIYTHAPFALLSVQTFLRMNWQITVYPQPIEAPFLSANSQGDSHYSSIRRDQHDDVAYLSEYQAGDPTKRIAWKQFAKTRKLLSKQTEGETSQASSSQWISYKDYTDDISHDLLASYLCQRILDSDNKHLPYIVELPNEIIHPQNGQRTKALTAVSFI